MEKIYKTNMDMCERIFNLLEERGISQKEFAEMLHLSPATVSNWRKGVHTSFTRYLGQISEILHTTPGWLFSGTGTKNFSDEQREEWIRQDKQRIELWEKQYQEEMLEVYYSTLEKLFAQNGITRSDFYEISQGRNPSQEKVQFISRVFEITPEQLFEIAKNNPIGVQDLQPKEEEKGPTPVAEGEPMYPPEYDLLSPEDKALVDNMIRSLSKKQQTNSGPTKLYIAARDGSRMEVELGGEIILPGESDDIPE